MRLAPLWELSRTRARQEARSTSMALRDMLIPVRIRSAERPPIGRGALAGLIGGLLGAGAMSLAHTLMAARDRSPRDGAEPTSKPADTGAGVPREEDATVKVAAWLAHRVGYTLDNGDKAKASTLVHYAFGGCVGAAYGALAEIVPAVKFLMGAPFGAAVWLGAHVVTVPALGLAPSPVERPLAEEGKEAGLHLLYGVVTEVTRRLVGTRRHRDD